VPSRVPPVPAARLLPLPLALVLVLATAGPATAADWGVEVLDFEFAPKARQIQVGDTVTWSFAAGGHTATAVRGQAASWDSGPKPSPEGATFRRRFTTPGRFQYFCTPHKDFMKGVIQVGEDREPDTFDDFRSRRSGRTVTIGFKLNEPATVTYKLSGPRPKTVKRGRLAAGRHSFKVKRLPLGAYRGTLTLEDDFDKKVTPKNSFVIR
jgi:plastocyanin